MVKATARHKDGTRVVILGLSQENCRRLVDGHPISIRLPDAFLPAETDLPSLGIVILGGETEESIIAEIAEHIPPGARS